MGALGELGGSLKWWSTRQTARAWFGAGGEAYLQDLLVGSKGRESTLVMEVSEGAGTLL
jgi:hypothetical protein